jgi:hypothetical protein
LENPIAEGEGDKPLAVAAGPGPEIGWTDVRKKRRERWLPFLAERLTDVHVASPPCRRWWELWKPASPTIEQPRTADALTPSPSP